jgi:hypothetical protein
MRTVIRHHQCVTYTIMPSLNDFFFHWLYSTIGPWPLVFQFYDNFTDGRTPWTSDQFVARPLPKHRTTQTQNKCIHIRNIHALCGIRTHDPGFWASEDNTCRRPLGYRERRIKGLLQCICNTLPVLICRREIQIYIHRTLRAGRPRSRSSSPGRIKNFLESHPTSFLIGTRPSFPGIKRPGHEADHSHPTSAEVKKTRIYTYTPPYAFMV